MTQISLNAADFAEPAAAPDFGFAIQKRTRQALMILGLLLSLLFLAAILVPIGGAVIGSGQIGVESRVKRIAHPVGGVISQIRVRDGDRVEKGDLLVLLDTQVTGVRADLSGRTVDQLLAQQARLEAEQEGRGEIVFPAALLTRSDDNAQDAMRAEARLFRLKRQERSGLRSQLEQRIIQLRKQITGFEAQIASLEKQQVLIEPERKGVQELWERGLVTINRRNQLERTAADLEGSVASLQSSIAASNARITETREQIIQIDQSARADAASELAQVNAALNEQQVQQVSASDMLNRSDIRAPYDGVVDKMAFATIGDVVQPAQTIMEIVPDSDQLIVEAQIRPADVDQVKVGQKARVRLSASAASQTPELPGKVTFVSAERTTERDIGASYYRVRIELDAKAVRKEKLTLVPGMPTEVFISTGSRSMMSYLTKPIADQLARSFRD